MLKLTDFFFKTLPGQIIVTASVLGACVLLYFHEPKENDKYPACMIYSATGLHCPGCGGIRGTHELLHGHVGQALDYNLFSTVLLMVLGIYFLGKGLQRIGIPFPLPRYNHKVMMGVLALLGLFVIARNIPIEPFSWLAPNRSPVYEHHNVWK